MKNSKLFHSFFSLIAIVIVLLTSGSTHNAHAQYDTVWTRLTEKSIVQVAFHPNSQLIATGTWDSYLSIWDISGNEITKLWGSRSNSGVEFSTDGKYLAYGGGELEEGSIKVVDCNTWGEVKKIVTPTNSLAFINDVNLIAIGGRKSITIWDFQTGELIRQINDIVSPDQQGSYYELFKMVYSSIINSIIYTASDGKLRFLNTQTYTIDYTYNAGYGELDISEEGRYIAFKTGLSGFAVQVMDIETKQIVQSIPGSASGINSIAFSPDGKYLAVAYDYAGACKIWKLETAKIAFDFKYGTHQNVAFSKNNQYLITNIAQMLILYNNPVNSVNSPYSNYDTLYPNPTNQSITIQFNLPKSENINIDIMTLDGKKLHNLYAGFLESGVQKILAETTGLVPGTYFIVINSETFSKTFKLMIIK